MTEDFKHFEPFAPRPLRVPASRITRLRRALAASVRINILLVLMMVGIGAAAVAIMTDNVALHFQVAHMHDQIVLLRR